MNRKKRIQSLLSNHFINSKIDVEDNSHEHIGHSNFNGSEESHFKVTISNRIKISKSKLQIHRKINELLSKEFSTGMHALEIKIIN